MSSIKNHKKRSAVTYKTNRDQYLYWRSRNAQSPKNK